MFGQEVIGGDWKKLYHDQKYSENKLIVSKITAYILVNWLAISYWIKSTVPAKRIIIVGPV